MLLDESLSCCYFCFTLLPLVSRNILTTRLESLRTLLVKTELLPKFRLSSVDHAHLRVLKLHFCQTQSLLI